MTKRYGEFTAVDNLSFTVNKGEIFGFLGPNGAGKTTTLNVLSTLSDFDGGEVEIAGYALPKQEFSVKRILGLVPQEIALYMDLTAQENVTMFASLYGLSGAALRAAVDEALAFVGLADEAKKRVKKMSGGQQRRLNIACGIAHGPELIIMDEPTVGVDARSRELIMGSIRTLNERGATIIYTSHYMPEVQELADRIAIIDHGRLAGIGTEEELLEHVTDRKTLRIGVDDKNAVFLSKGVEGKSDVILREVAESSKNLLEQISRLPGVKHAAFSDGQLRVDVDLTLPSISPILGVLMERGVAVKSLAEEAPTLETTFLALTGNELTKEGA
ncbi:MAG: ABC transporter ATP-binding protein [Clostridiales Family XIII bacterium]|nr:ABC transporter ATP-binding protein [Clostridiales Family XIII bacterium]